MCPSGYVVAKLNRKRLTSLQTCSTSKVKMRMSLSWTSPSGRYISVLTHIYRFMGFKIHNWLQCIPDPRRGCAPSRKRNMFGVSGSSVTLNQTSVEFWSNQQGEKPIVSVYVTSLNGGIQTNPKNIVYHFKDRTNCGAPLLETPNINHHEPVVPPVTIIKIHLIIIDQHN